MKRAYQTALLAGTLMIGSVANLNASGYLQSCTTLNTPSACAGPGCSGGCTVTSNPNGQCLGPSIDYCLATGYGSVTGTVTPGACKNVIITIVPLHVRCDCVTSGPATPTSMTPACT